jgi:hypothetical protein
MTRYGISEGNVMREFETENFIVRASAEEEFDLDLSWDEDGSVREGLESGKFIAFVAHVEVIHKDTGAVLGEDYLDNCIYKSFDDFMNHRACGRQNRKLKKQHKAGRCGSYFTDMIHEAITEARRRAAKLQTIPLRVSAVAQTSQSA